MEVEQVFFAGDDQIDLRGASQGQHLIVIRIATLQEIKELAQDGDKDAKTAWKLLNDLRFKK